MYIALLRLATGAHHGLDAAAGLSRSDVGNHMMAASAITDARLQMTPVDQNLGKLEPSAPSGTSTGVFAGLPLSAARSLE